MHDDMETWAEMLAATMESAGDPGPVVAYAPGEAAFDVRFDSGYGLAGGPPVLAWTATYVYFPVVYDGSEWLASAPRNPTGEWQRHVGGQ